MRKRRRISKSLAGALGHTCRGKVSLAPVPWDTGADGPANREGLVQEPATEIDPETGKETPNPNRVTRMRRRDWIDTYLHQGRITVGQAEIARELRAAFEGARNADPLAAMQIQIDKDSRAPDPQAAAYDARRKFHRMWPLVPAISRPAIEAVVIEGRPITSFARGRAVERHMQRLTQGLAILRERWTNA